MRKLKKGEKNIILTIIKVSVFIIVFAMQIGFFYLMYTGGLMLERYSVVFSQVIRLTALIYILYGHERQAYKIAWISLITILPIAGILIYLLFGKIRTSKRLKKDRDDTVNASHYLFVDDTSIIEEIKKDSKYINRIFESTRNITKYPVYKNEGVKYFESGEKYFQELINDLKKAKHYIFIEYFIISKGALFNEIFEILKEKAASGVEVKIIADAWGSMNRLPRDIYDDCQELGIEFHRYNKIKYGISNYINYRDHRKIVVIDGLVAYTGGLNIGDEYINNHIRFGHWKDTGIKVFGKPVESFTIAFLKMLQIITKTKPDYETYINNIRNLYSSGNEKELTVDENKTGYTMFYSDGPDNRKNPGENAYTQILNTAKDYVYIFTPYFVVSESVLDAILRASRSGIDVRIVTPHKPDKWYMHVITRSYYDVLLESNVKVYEYLPGFLHAKSFVADDEIAIVSSINLDFRSMNLNYECGLLTYKTGVEQDIKCDFQNIVSQSREIKLEDVKNKKFITRIVEAIVNTFGPAL